MRRTPPDPDRHGRWITVAVMVLAIVGAFAVLRWVLEAIFGALNVSSAVAAALVGLGLGVLVLGVVFLSTIATREEREQQSLRRIRARIFEHDCPLCGIRHGGVGK